MRRVGGEHDPADPRVDADDLEPAGVAADPVQGQPRGQFRIAVVEGDPAVEHAVDHLGDVLGLEGVADRRLGHVAPGREGHLGVLQVEARLREGGEAADMVVVQVGDDHVRRRAGVDADRREAVGDRPQQLAVALLGIGRGEAGVDHPASVGADHGPDEIVHRHRPVVGIAADEHLGAPADPCRVAHGVDCIVGKRHGSFPPLDEGRALRDGSVPAPDDQQPRGNHHDRRYLRRRPRRPPRGPGR